MPCDDRGGLGGRPSPNRRASAFPRAAANRDKRTRVPKRQAPSPGGDALGVVDTGDDEWGTSTGGSGFDEPAVTGVARGFLRDFRPELVQTQSAPDFVESVWRAVRNVKVLNASHFVLFENSRRGAVTSPVKSRGAVPRDGADVRKRVCRDARKRARVRRRARQRRRYAEPRNRRRAGHRARDGVSGAPVAKRGRRAGAGRHRVSSVGVHVHDE
mmetsp:Transcript_10149/g.33563  ORF Transcript_10149/g.33563 Transcript_10149/m.33563 type:complete len:214 (+) Transcript_10149:250-891(+)